MRINLGFIGVGHMAGSLLRAMVKEGAYSFYVQDHHLDKMEALSKEFPGKIRLASNEEIVRDCSFVFLGVKPTDMSNLIDELKNMHGSPIFVSMAAGYNLLEIKEHLGEKKIIRIMPNTPVAVGKGVTFATYEGVGEGEKECFQQIMSHTGSLYEIEEAKMDVVSVLTGSTPAYLDYFLDALAEFGAGHGFSKEEATEYVLKMAEGVIALGQASEKSPLELGKEVCSPGGSTIEGVKVLLDEKMPETVRKAAEASLAKTKKMK